MSIEELMWVCTQLFRAMSTETALIMRYTSTGSGNSTIDVHSFGMIKIFSGMMRSPKVYRRTLAARGPRKVVGDASPRTVKYF
jgi:hypothetical protein